MPDIAADSIAVITWEQDFGVTDLPSRVGWQFPVTHLGQELVDPEWPIHTFRLRDEDDEIHYRGLVRNDPQGENQAFLSLWGERDTGGFLIEVLLDGKWVMEVG
jgi:hypothetical protein